MNLEEILKKNFSDLIKIEEIGANVSRLYAPLFYEDGDMLSIYLTLHDGNNITIHDFGNTLMRISYTFDIDTPNKVSILNSIVNGYDCKIDNGELAMNSSVDRLPESILQFSQMIAKVSNIEILRHEIVKSLFYDNLSEFIEKNLSKYNVKENFIPTSDKHLIVDFRQGISLP